MTATYDLTDLEERTLRYLERSRELGRVWVPPRIIAGAAHVGVVHILRALDRLAALGFATEDLRVDHRTYTITELGFAELRRRCQLELEIAS